MVMLLIRSKKLPVSFCFQMCQRRNQLAKVHQAMTQLVNALIRDMLLFCTAYSQDGGKRRQVGSGTNRLRAPSDISIYSLNPCHIFIIPGKNTKFFSVRKILSAAFSWSKLLANDNKTKFMVKVGFGCAISLNFSDS